MSDTLPCGHPAAAWIDHPGWGWCGQCAQQAEAALPPPRPGAGGRTRHGGDDVSEAQSHEHCVECGREFTLVALPWKSHTAAGVLTLLRKFCCVCDPCLARILADAAEPGAGEETR